MDNILQAMIYGLYSVSKGCRETVLYLCRDLGKAVHETPSYPQVSYAQTLALTYAMG